MSDGHSTTLPNNDNIFGGATPGAQTPQPIVTGDQTSAPVVENVATGAVEEECDAMEGAIHESGYTVKKLSELTASMRQAVLARRPELYPPVLTLNGGRVNTEAIFALQGSDVPNNIPRKVSSSGKIECVLGFRSDTLGGLDPKAVFVGATLQTADLMADAQQQPAGKGKGKKPQNPLKNAPAPAPRDCVKVKFHLDSQLPHIEITTRKLGQDAGKSALHSTRIWADELALDTNQLVNVFQRPAHNAPLSLEEIDTVGEQGNANFEELSKLRDEGRLIELTFTLKPSTAPRVWTGLRHADVEEIRGRSREQSTKDKTITRDLVIQKFDNARHLSFYIGVDKAELLNEWDQLCVAFRNVLSLTHHGGNFWAYRLQLEAAGMDRQTLDEISLPRIEWEIPRFLVTAWRFKFTPATDNTPKVYSEAEPYTWVHHRVFDQLKNPNESAFLLKQGIIGESDRQTRNLMELVQSKDQCFFRGKFTHIPGADKGAFTVEVFVSQNAFFGKKSPKMPPFNTGITIELDPINPEQPDQGRMVKYQGVVVQDLFNNGAAFCCVVHGPEKPFVGSLDLSNHHAIYISYPIRTLTRDRQLLATEKIQGIDSQNKPNGVDLKALFLGDETSAPATDYLASSLTPLQHTQFEAYLDCCKKPKLNKAQKESAINTIQSSSGVTVIQGSPGCGKTDLMVATAAAHVAIGHRVMICALQNEAVLNVQKTFHTFLKSNRGLDELAYVHVTAAYTNIYDSEKLKAKNEVLTSAKEGEVSEEQAEAIVNRSNALTEYARIAQTKRGIVPAHDWIFGSKLKAMIEKWASEDSTVPDLKAAARDYFAACEFTARIKDKADRKKHLRALGDLEKSLGAYYLKDYVKVVFCTLSTSAYPQLVSSFAPDELMIDESARESIGGLIVPCGAFRNSIKHISLVGDRKQSRGVLVSRDSNIGYAALSRNLSQEIAENILYAPQ